MHMLKFLIVLIICVQFCGCEKTGNQASRDSNSGYEHGHLHEEGGHSHESQPHLYDQETTSESDQFHGIHGGHKFTFEPADYMGEWLITSEDVTKVFVLDKAGENAEPVKADVFDLRRGDTVFSLDPVGTDVGGRSATYRLADQDLSIAINLGVDVAMEIGDKKYVGKITPPQPHQH